MLRQYQELVGPVLVPAADFNPADLSWSPAGEQPARSVARRRLGDYTRPEPVPAQPTASGQSDDFDLLHYQELAGPVFVPAAVEFDPSVLSWGPIGQQPQRRLPTSQIRDFAPVQFDALYRAEGLEWIPSARQPVRRLLTATLAGFSPVEFGALYRAEGLDWTPSAQQPARAIPPGHLGDFEQPHFDSLYRSDGLEWEPSGTQPERGLPPRRLGDYVRPDLVPPAQPTSSGQSDDFLLFHYQELTGPVFVPVPVAFDPAVMSWGPAGAQPQRGIPPRRLGDFAPVQFEGLYRAEGLEWGSRAPSPRFNPARRVTYSVTDPFPPAAPFDPSGLQWKPIETGSGLRVPVPRITYSVADPFPVAAAPAFDPSGLQWIPRDRITHRARRQGRGELLQPPRAALYDPSRIEWLSSGRHAGRALQRYRVTYEVEDLLPRPRAPAPVVPVEEVTTGPIQQPLRPTLRLRPRARFQKRRLREPKKLRQYRREIRLLTERTEALAAALTYAEQQQNAEALAAAMRMAEAVEIELTAYLERRRMMQVIAITLLLLEDA